MAGKLFSRAWMPITFAAFAFIVLWKGILPSLENARGDFANYYTAARLLAEDKPLGTAYRDFVWFQKQIDRYGITRQLGGFIPHPPPTALIMLPLSQFPPLTAKRIWIGFNIVLGVLSVLLTAKITKLPWLAPATIVLSTGIGLINNFLFGQMYLLVLFSIVGGLFLLHRGYPIWGGIVLGLMIPVKFVGGFFVIYALWKRQWRFVFASIATTAAMMSLVALLQGAEIFHVFVDEVLPRHVQGEIQEPFAIQFQSWNALLRRMFVANPSLNPQPPFESPLCFSLCKNVIMCLWLAAFVWMFRHTRFSNLTHQRLFEIGLIPVCVLLISPGGATYHFLLLSLSVTCFTKILLDLQQPRHAIILWVLFVVVNLPHYPLLSNIAVGWLTPVGYLRLWLLVVLFFLICFLLRRAANWYWRPRTAASYVFSALLIATVMTAVDLRRAAAKEDDEAQWLPLHEREFDRHLGLLVKTPDIGQRRIVFSYGELRDEDYAVFSMTIAGRVEGQWTPESPHNFYEPDIAFDDQRVLMESIRNGQSEIWYSRGKRQAPEFLVQGELPHWNKDASGFAFLRDGKIGLAVLRESSRLDPRWLNTPDQCYDLAYSPIDDRIVFCAERTESKEFILALLAVGEAERHVLVQSSEPLEKPIWSPDAAAIVFSWNRDGNRDLWAVILRTRELIRLTRDPAIDSAPLWDDLHHRIVFISDRGRGLEVGSMFTISLPEKLMRIQSDANGQRSDHVVR